MLKLSPTRTIIRGDSDLFKVSFIKRSQVHYHDCSSKCIKKEEKTPIDITGWEVRFTVRPEVPDSSIIDDDDALISIEAEIVNAEEGIAVIYVQSEDTYSLPEGNYLYDIQVVRPEDEFSHRQVNSIRKGKYVILGDITRETSDDDKKDYEDVEIDIDKVDAGWYGIDESSGEHYVPSLVSIDYMPVRPNKIKQSFIRLPIDLLKIGDIITASNEYVVYVCWADFVNHLFYKDYITVSEAEEPITLVPPTEDYVQPVAYLCKIGDKDSTLVTEEYIEEAIKHIKIKRLKEEISY